MIVVTDEVREASAVVALETTLIAHGFPRGEGVAVGLQSEARIRETGAVPATIGVLDGQIRVGLAPEELERFDVNARKVGPRGAAVERIRVCAEGPVPSSRLWSKSHTFSTRVPSKPDQGGTCHLNPHPGTAPGRGSAWPVRIGSCDLGCQAGVGDDQLAVRGQGAALAAFVQECQDEGSHRLACHVASCGGGERLLEQRLDVLQARVRRTREQQPAAPELPMRRRDLGRLRRRLDPRRNRRSPVRGPKRGPAPLVKIGEFC